MEITYLGHSSFRLRGKSATLICDPYGPEVGFKMPKEEADVVTISHDHFDHNRADLVGGDPFVVDGPGEYEVKEILIKGVRTYHDKKEGAERGPNCAYLIVMDDLNLCHLGDLGHKLTDKQIEALNGVDILFVPVGGNVVLAPEEAMAVINQIEPSIVIPMHYRQEGTAASIPLVPVDEFLKEAGQDLKPQPKLIISKDKLPEEQEVIVLLPKG